MRGSLVHALSGFGAAAWTPAQLPAGVLLYWSGRTLAQVASATDGTGSVDGLSDSSLAAYLADLSPSGKPLIEATSGSRPYVGYSALGQGMALIGAGGRRLIAGSSLAGVRHVFAAMTPVGRDVLRPGAGADEEANFASDYQSYVSNRGVATPAYASVVGDTGTNNIFHAGALSGTAYVDGVATYDIGRQRRRRVVRFSRDVDATTGPLAVLTYGADAIPALGAVHEVVVLSASASAGDLAQVQTYMDWHRATPTVVCTLDSLSACYNINTYQAWPHLLWRNRWRGCVSVVNLGIPGQTITTANGSDPAKLAANKGQGKNICVLLGGANDILAGASAATVWTRLQTYITAATAAGWQVVVCSVPSGSGYSGPQQTVLSTLRGLIAAGWSAAGASGYVDLFGLTLTLQGDGIHFTSGDCTTVASTIGPAVDALL